MSLAAKVKDLRERTGAGMMDCKKAIEASNGDIDQAIDWLRENGIAKAAKKGDRVAAEGLTKVIIEGNKAVIVELNAETDFVAKNDQFLDLLNTISTALVNSDAKTLEEGLAVDVNGQTISELVAAGTATIGEKIDLRRFEIVEKTDEQTFADYSHMGGTISVLLTLDGNNDEVAKQIAMHVAAANPQFLNSESVDPEVLAKETAIITKETKENAGGKPENIIEKMIDGRVNKFLKEICLVNQAFVVDPSLEVEKAAANAGLTIIGFNRFEVGEGIEKVETNFAEEVAQQMKA
ncbi:translation elongation factor Ts [Mollicutes bacterium LVI A0078]|nr:translation elongation factor Ts [Mollicutes bacterium LVI A0075]WOO90972.1 translation elongation factor Ts [Mollicutes bacterium LVI A0078]